MFYHYPELWKLYEAENRSHFAQLWKRKFLKENLTCFSIVHVRQSCRKIKKNKHLDNIPVSFFPSTPTGNLKLSGLFIELSNKSSKVKFELPDAEASGFYDQVTYLNSKPLIELSILAVYLAVSLFACIVTHSTRKPWQTNKCFLKTCRIK